MTEAQAKYGVERTDSVSKELEKWKGMGANLLLPSTNIEGLSEFHAPVIDSVYLSANPKDGDVYPASGGDDNNSFRLAAQGIRKLSVCAGIIWHPYECRRLDDRKDRHYVACQAVGGIRKADGQPVWWRGEYDLDFEVIEEELIDQYTAKCKSWNKSDAQKQGYVDSNVRKDLLFKRKHKLKLAETGAMNRVARAILGLKGSYTREELAKPFVMLRIVLRPDFTDKDVRAKLADAAINAMVGIYGPETPIEQRQTDLSGLGEVIDIPKEDGPEPEPENGHDDEPSAREVFVALDIDEKAKVVRELATKKRYDVDSLERPPEKLSERILIQLYDHLDALLFDDDDIPF
jgi:hypothetical protein